MSSQEILRALRHRRALIEVAIAELEPLASRKLTPTSAVRRVRGLKARVKKKILQFPKPGRRARLERRKSALLSFTNNRPDLLSEG